MFKIAEKEGYKEILPEISLKTLVYGKKMLLSEFVMKKGSHLPAHSHPHEQTGYLVQGRLLLTIGKEIYKVGPGDSWCIESNIEHSAEVLEDSRAIEVFSPLREDYLPC